jgi:hypothetical protein
LDPEFLEYRSIRRIIFILVILNKLIGQVMVDKKGGEIGIVSLPIAVD